MRPRFSKSPFPHMRPGFLAALGVAALLAGCVYRMNIQQGNYLEQRAVSRLEVGMTRSQVRYLLGTPMVPDTFDKDRWDYLYYLKKGRLSAPEQRHLIVYFEGDKVARIDNSKVGAMPPVEQRERETPAESAAQADAQREPQREARIGDSSGA